MRKKNGKTLTIQDISPLIGIYDDYIVCKDKLMTMAKVEGINMDLLDTFGRGQVFDGYGSFLLSISTNKDKILNVSMTSKIDMVRYNLFWKRKYIEVERDMQLPKDKKENLLQLIASKCLYIEEISSKSEITTKRHVIVVTASLAGYTYELLDAAREELTEKVERLISTFKDSMSEFEIGIEQLTSSEILDILMTFTDNKTAMSM